ncbi:MAG: tol-pal system protein YbgF [Candidatus Methylomirabilota bacterium]
MQNGRLAGAALLGAVPLIAGLTAGCVATGDDIQALRRDLSSLRQEVSGMAKAQESARVLTDERLSRLESEFSGRFEATVKETEGSRAALATRLDELATETRLVQGKLEENAFVLTNLNNRLDEIDQAGRQRGRRLDGLEQQVKALSPVPPPAPVPGSVPGPGVGQPPVAQPPASPPAAGQPFGTPLPAPQAPGAPSPVPQPPAISPPAAQPAAAAPATGQPPAAQPPPAVATRPAQPSPAVLPPEDVYRAALNDYTKGNYDLAISGFRTYIQNYPKTSLVPNAQYWLGESYYSQKNYAQAIEEFEVVIRDYPDNPKVPSALFKQGDALLQMNDTKRATAVLCELIGKHGKTREARLAREKNIRCR